MTSISFGKVITNLMTGVIVEVETEKYFKESTIIKYSEKILKGLILEEYTEDILIKKLFNKVFQVYKEDIEESPCLSLTTSSPGDIYVLNDKH